MPGFNLPDSQISDLVAFLHQRNRDARLRFTYKIPNVAVGNAAAGKTYFDAHCAPCHLTSHNLAGIGSKYHADELQQAFTREDHDPSRDAFIQGLLERFGIHAEELGGTMMKKLTELFDEDMDAAWARAASERAALVV